MRQLVQWTLETPPDWDDVDTSQWASLPTKTGTDLVDDLPGWIYALNLQGVIFSGYDHYAVEELGDGSGGVRVTVWYDPLLAGDNLARVWIFLPLAPDARLGGALNTRQVELLYAERREMERQLQLGKPDNAVFLPYTDFIPPPPRVTKHGKFVSDLLAAQHGEAQSKTLREGWRGWTEGLALEELDEEGLVAVQYDKGRHSPRQGTITYIQRDTSRNSGVHVSSNELAFENALGSSNTVTESIMFNSDELAFLFTSPANDPNNSNWPSGNYRCQIDVTSAGVNTTYGFLTIGGSAGHMARVNSGLTADQGSVFTQVEGVFSGSGLRLATTGTIDPPAGAAGDRYEWLLAAANSAAMGNENLILRMNIADSFADGAWEGPEILFARVMPQLHPRAALRAAPYAYWTDNLLAVAEEVVAQFPPIRPMVQLHPRAAPRAAPYSYWNDNLLAVEEFPPVQPMPQLHPRAALRGSPLLYWNDNLLAVEERVFPPIRPMVQLHPRAAPRASPLPYWIDNLLAVLEPAVAQLPPIRPMDQLLPRAALRGSPLLYWIDNFLAIDEPDNLIRPMLQLLPRAALRAAPYDYWHDNLLAIEEPAALIRPMDQLLPRTALRASPLLYWIDNFLAIDEPDNLIRPMPQLLPRAALWGSPLSYWLDNLLAIEEPPALIRPMDQLLPRAAARAAPYSYWRNNLLAVEEVLPPPIRPMDQLHPRAALRGSPLSYWIDNLLAVAEIAAVTIELTYAIDVIIGSPAIGFQEKELILKRMLVKVLQLKDLIGPG